MLLPAAILLLLLLLGPVPAVWKVACWSAAVLCRRRAPSGTDGSLLLRTGRPPSSCTLVAAVVIWTRPWARFAAAHVILAGALPVDLWLWLLEGSTW
jgi:hypothetical protein